MARSRDPFALALHSLRERAASGAFHPERPIVILDEARRLGLSTTPVREALAWLAGEGLVQRAASSGYLGARLDAVGVRHRYGFRLQCLRLAFEAARPPPPCQRVVCAGAAAQSATALFRVIVRSAGDDVLESAFGRVERQLGVLTASEGRVLTGVAEEAAELAGHVRAWSPELLRTLGAYHRRRADAAVALLLDLAAPAGDPGAGAGPPGGSP